MKYINILREGERITQVFLCKYKESALTKNGKPYENVILQDRTGVLDGKIWEPDSQGIADFGAFDYIFVMGDVTRFQGALQLNIKRVRKAQEGEYDPKDYIPVSDRDIDTMYQELKQYMGKVENPYLQQLLEGFFLDAEFEKQFKHHSAAKTVHHGFMGGLLEHTLGVTGLCEAFCRQYPVLNRDLLLTAAMFHDIGKLKELSTFPLNDYTDEGQLLGHIVIGTEWVGEHIREIPGFPQKLSTELKHCILAHHGEYEFGSPKKPALIEAVALNFADNMDAKMETLKEVFSNVPEGNTEWLGYNRLFESNIRKTSR
ncbi:MAG: HD domain-containing protein [Lachnospiraceae bacterium]|nr:HD domain-containing protein [Lachnospiraceae bacterium]